MKKSIKLVALVMAFVMAFCFMTGCGKSSSDEGATGSSDGVTIFNSKMEIQDQRQNATQRRQACR